ncbi:class A beta-lactamase [Roseibium sp.]|uniref:class A beta-lactamase n=1 Tax=Roseibium sp. TaxID=1936156 RepID=UPI003A9713D3
MDFHFRTSVRTGRHILFAVALKLIALHVTVAPGTSQAQAFDPAPLAAKVAEVGDRLSARIGVAVIDAQGKTIWSVRGDERFPLNSTFKAFACAHLLKQIEEGRLSKDAAVPVTARDLLAYVPISKKLVGQGDVALTTLCSAAMTVSDNTAANLVLAATGGPEKLTGFLRSSGDDATRLDRYEPELNEAKPGDPRDTTTPIAAGSTLVRLVFGSSLSSGAKRQLLEWMLNNEVSGRLLRAGLPDGWRVADRSGAGGHGSRSIVAVVWPPSSQPVVVAVYLTQTPAAFEARNQAIAEIGAALGMSLGAGSK